MTQDERAVIEDNVLDKSKIALVSEERRRRLANFELSTATEAHTLDCLPVGQSLNELHDAERFSQIGMPVTAFGLGALALGYLVYKAYHFVVKEETTSDLESPIEADVEAQEGAL